MLYARRIIYTYLYAMVSVSPTATHKQRCTSFFSFSTLSVHYWLLVYIIFGQKNIFRKREREKFVIRDKAVEVLSLPEDLYKKKKKNNSQKSLKKKNCSR